MIPAGYLLKRIVPPSTWLGCKLPHVNRVCSAAGCVSGNIINLLVEGINNSFDLANNPEQLMLTASKSNINVGDATLFYYTSYELELPSDGWNFDPTQWRGRSPVVSAQLPDDVVVPLHGTAATLLGYDVVVFEYGLAHSPISCNGVVERILVNEHCLLNSFEEALGAINEGVFGFGCEEGNYTIFSVAQLG